MAEWEAFPPRQLTGKPRVYHGYVGQEARILNACGHNHRSLQAARECSAHLARRLNKLAMIRRAVLGVEPG